MAKYRIFLSLVLLWLLIGSNAEAQQIQWPHHKKAVIILTYDDALRSQLNTAVPQLEKAGLKATFFLTGEMDSETIPQWRKLGKKGYELGNHTIFHPCLSTDDNPVASEGYTAYRMIREIGMMNNFLFAVDGKTSRTLAYPCTETLAGGRDFVDSLKLYNIIKYARIGGDVDAVITDFGAIDPLRIPSYGLDNGTTGAQLIQFVKRVQEKGGLGIIMLHGVGGDYITVSPEAHQQLISYLKQNKKDIWVPTFQEGMDYVMKNRTIKNTLANLAAMPKRQLATNVASAK